MLIKELQNKIESFFKDEKSSLDEQEVIQIVDEVIKLLNTGQIRVSEKIDGYWIVNSWIKKAILLGFSFKKQIKQEFNSFDKFGLLNFDYDNPRYRKVPGAIIRDGVYIGNNAVIMPSYINIGAYVGNRTMIDINSVVGSCAQIGENCHISAMACIGGVLEPVVSNPVIIEDNCFIGAQSSVLEGVIVEENSVIASGVTITASTKIIDRETKEITTGVVKSGSVVVPGSYPKDGVNISCAVIIKKVDAKTKSKSSINEILRGI
ncbi:MAG: 2,3,4,5-tetrahydropyridine-2,6-dicarboxylate N-succinyltransferase [Holosporales bacterium]|jgi:2,3,4,5-tetrahydropyridine-2-carboxylate N-succinyltransferase|nr:2,3,4,5-tetrahydropyridine-2,6-dicarboxylate N-succinyltransferase [Holosporales bacterium]